MDHSGFETERLRLEPLSETKHFDGFHAIWTDERCAAWSPRGTTKSEQDSRRWMQGVLPNPDKLNFAVVLRTNEEEPMIGVFGCHKVNSPIAELGYILNANYWGQGYATEALRAFIPTFFERRPDIKEMHAITDPENHASNKVLQKLGFVTIEHDLQPVALPIFGPEPRPGKPLMFSLSRDA
ncbi:GNAT domain-containing protein [Flagelloscypha sp. PMI_526]|nr:GNAT domain-containing protein [Flagelloscypha sp. PMI_526]